MLSQPRYSAKHFVTALFVMGLATGLVAQEDNAAALQAKSESAIHAANELSQQGKWRRAKQAWLNILRHHAGADYLRPRLPDIREAIFNADFWSNHRRPSEKRLISGELDTYVKSSGRIEVEYGRDNLEDFEAVGELKIHPLNFRGKHSIEIEASPSLLPMLFLCLGEDRGYRLQFGGRYRGYTMFRIEGGRETEVDDGSTRLRGRSRNTRVAKVKAVVTKTQISVTYNGRQLFKVKKTDASFGQVAFLSPAQFDSLKLSGLASNSWIEGVVDQSMQKEWTEFESAWEPPKEFAAWDVGASQNMPSPSLPEEDESMPYPDSFTDEQWKQVHWIVAMLDAGQLQRARGSLALMTDRQIPPATRKFLLAQMELRSGRIKRAIDHLEPVVARKDAAPEHRLLHARLLIPTERTEQAISAYREMLRERGDMPSLHYELAEILMLNGQAAEARRQVEASLGQFPNQSDLTTLLGQIVKVEQGPPWRRSFRKESDHFVVVSEQSQSVSTSASRELEASWKYFQERFGEISAEAGKTPVYLFSGEAGYKDYIEGIAYEAPDNTAGIYSSRLGQILVWNLASGEKIQHTLRHEALHRYLHLRLGKTPHWFNEGLAEYLAHAKVGRREWVEGSPSSYWAMVLRRYELKDLPLQEFLSQDHAAFMAKAQINYALSWAMVDYLLTSGEAEREFFDALWKILEGEIDAGTAVAEVMETVQLGELEQGFRAHLLEIQAR
ncbi:MAG: tetratricopeptide repeat protein [Planctomycetota bacterium]|jgi:tetratricopeptide (TPR) repeat protein